MGSSRRTIALVAAGGLLWLAAIDVDGGYVADLLGPSLVVGAGAGVAWVASMVGATSGVEESASGLASGLVNTSQQFGGALGIAALVAVATSRTADVLAAGEPDRLAALTEGYSAGLVGGAIAAAAGAVLALVLLPARERPRAGLKLQPAETGRSAERG
jgi:hypothetical protein